MQPKTLTVEVYGTPGSAEYKAALRLREILLNDLNLEEPGWVAIHTDVYLLGQKREQIDILVHAFFPKGISRSLRLDGADRERDVIFQDFVAVIEVKAHSREGVQFSSTNVDVRYDNGWKSASSQSCGQVYSLKPFLERKLGWSPWICNLIFFPNLWETDLASSPGNCIAGDSSFSAMLERLCLSKKIQATAGQNRSIPFSCFSAFDEESRLSKNEELKSLLRPERTGTEHPVPPAFVIRKKQEWHVSAPPPPLPPPIYRLSNGYSRRQRVSRPQILVALILFVLVIIAAISISMRMASFVERRRPVDQAVIRTCVTAKRSSSCLQSTRFDRASTVTIQLEGMQRPLSAILRAPNGKIIPLSFRDLKLSSSDLKDRSFVAKHRIPRDAPSGYYSIQVSSSNAHGGLAANIFSSFEVLP